MKVKNILLIAALLCAWICLPTLQAQVTIGDEKQPESFSVLELISNQKGGLRLPQMNNAQRDAMTKTSGFVEVKTTEAIGLTIFNTTINCVEYWNGKRWVSLCAGEDISDMTSNSPEKDYTAGVGDLITITNPGCTETSGSWKFELITGTEYASISSANTSEGTFKITWKENGITADRIATVRVTDKCGNTQEFTYTQKQNSIRFYPTYNTYNNNYNYLFTGAVFTAGTGDDKTRGTGEAYVNVDAGVFKYTKASGHKIARQSFTHDSGLRVIIAQQDLTDGVGSIAISVSGTPSTGWAGKAFDIPVTLFGWDLTVRVSTGCGAYTGDKLKVDANLNAIHWLQFQCYNLGVTDTTLDPFTPAQGIHGAKYRFGAAQPSYSMADDQSNSEVIPGWTFNNTTEFPLQEAGNWSSSNNPCPTGWRLPTRAEWKQVIERGNGSNNNSIFFENPSSWDNSDTDYTNGLHVGPQLFLPAAGMRVANNGKLYDRGSHGYYWSSMQDSSTHGSYLCFTYPILLSVFMGSNFLASGYSVRCVAE